MTSQLRIEKQRVYRVNLYTTTIQNASFFYPLPLVLTTRQRESEAESRADVLPRWCRHRTRRIPARENTAMSPVYASRQNAIYQQTPTMFDMKAGYHFTH